MEIQGKHNTAKIYTNSIDKGALSQLYNMLNIPCFAESKIAVMPDVHVGKGSVVGFTMTFNNFINPNVIGVDIGCGIDAFNLGPQEVDLAQFDQFNRETMARIIIECFFSKKPADCKSISSIHNYLNFDDNIVRKGAISAHKNEEVIIPLNMRDGCIIGKGKGNPDWNYSAPHGAGRRLKRSETRQLLSLEEYKQAMKGIYSSCISKDTLDESPMAYKDSGEIQSLISETVEIEKIIKPIYNFKA